MGPLFLSVDDRCAWYRSTFALCVPSITWNIHLLRCPLFFRERLQPLKPFAATPQPGAACEGLASILRPAGDQVISPQDGGSQLRSPHGSPMGRFTCLEAQADRFTVDRVKLAPEDCS